MSEIECPYCQAELKVNHNDGFGYAQDETHQMECKECKKNFVFTTHISFHYSPEKAGCLNGEQHDYQLTHTAPKCASTMRCTMCDDEREPTQEERTKFQLGTKEDYFKSLLEK